MNGCQTGAEAVARTLPPDMKTPGRPALYATTKSFLDDLGLASLEQLPALDVGAEPLPFEALQGQLLDAPQEPAAAVELAGPLAELAAVAALPEPASAEVPAELLAEAPSPAPLHAPVDADAPDEALIGAPTDAPVDVPADVPMEAPVVSSSLFGADGTPALPTPDPSAPTEPPPATPA